MNRNQNHTVMFHAMKNDMVSLCNIIKTPAVIDMRRLKKHEPEIISDHIINMT